MPGSWQPSRGAPGPSSAMGKHRATRLSLGSASFAACTRHKERTAAVLGISMKTLYSKLKEYHRESG